jgi:hypothetical protein
VLPLGLALAGSNADREDPLVRGDERRVVDAFCGWLQREG